MSERQGSMGIQRYSNTPKVSDDFIHRLAAGIFYGPISFALKEQLEREEISEDEYLDQIEYSDETWEALPAIEKAPYLYTAVITINALNNDDEVTLLPTRHIGDVVEVLQSLRHEVDSALRDLGASD